MNPWLWNPIFWNSLYIKANFDMNPMPPTMQDIMDAMANYENPQPVKIKDLARATHTRIFDFEYPLSSQVNKDEFEIQILNHFILRRIGFETFTAFKIYLENKLNEIMPYYNILFDSLSNYNLFGDGEKITRTEIESQDSTNQTNSDSSSESESDRRFNEFPQNKLETIKKGSYVTTQNYKTIFKEIDFENNNKYNEFDELVRDIKQIYAEEKANEKIPENFVKILKKVI